MTQALVARYRGLICDLDGVVYAGEPAVEHAVESLSAAGVPVVYATNNASRPPQEVAQHLRRLGLSLRDEDVVTSSVAAAAWLAERLSPEDAVLPVGGPGVAAALREHGVRVCEPGDPGCAAVVQGYGPDVTARDLAEAAIAIQGGARWVATNDDLTLPTDRGQTPGNGSLVRAVGAAVDVLPDVIGKPHAPMYLLAADRLGADPGDVLAIGDRLETDIAGGSAAGTPSALVLTGVHGVTDAASADPSKRPGHVLSDLRGLLEPYPQAGRDGDWFVRGEARARIIDGPQLDSEGSGIDRERAALDAVWSAVDDGSIDPEQAGRLMAPGEAR